MTRARGASRPRFRLLPTVLLTLAILGLPTVVYAWGRSSSSFDITTVEVAGTRLVPEKRALRLLRRDYAGHNLFTVTGRRRAHDPRDRSASSPASPSTATSPTPSRSRSPSTSRRPTPWPATAGTSSPRTAT